MSSVDDAIPVRTEVDAQCPASNSHDTFGAMGCDPNLETRTPGTISDGTGAAQRCGQVILRSHPTRVQQQRLGRSGPFHSNDASRALVSRELSNAGKRLSPPLCLRPLTISDQSMCGAPTTLNCATATGIRATRRRFTRNSAIFGPDLDQKGRVARRWWASCAYGVGGWGSGGRVGSPVGVLYAGGGLVGPLVCF